jgi:hypothetical protein
MALRRLPERLDLGARLGGQRRLDVGLEQRVTGARRGGELRVELARRRTRDGPGSSISLAQRLAGGGRLGARRRRSARRPRAAAGRWLLTS